MGARENSKVDTNTVTSKAARRPAKVSAASCATAAHVSMKPTKRTKEPISSTVTKATPTRVMPSRAGARAEEKARLARAARASQKVETASAGTSATSANTATAKHASTKMAVAKAAVAKAGIATKARQAKEEKPSFVERAKALKGAGRIALIVIGAIALVAVALYGPARDNYIAYRTSEALSSQLNTINSNNESLRSDVNSLQSREGIEDAARQRGYVTDGDTGVSVTGLTSQESTTDAVTESGSETTASASPWYIDVFDFIFGYQAS